MQISYQFRYQKVLPLLPRQRKVRYEEAEGEYIVQVKEVSEEDAPIAFLECFNQSLDYRTYDRETYKVKTEKVENHIREWRYYKDQLWTSEEPNSWKVEPYELKELYEKSEYSVGICSWKDTWEEAIQKIEKHFQKYIIVNGKAYLPAYGEPRLYWKYDSYSRDKETRIYIATTYEYQQEKDRYYRIDQIKELLEEVDSVLEEGEPRPELPVTYQIFIPEAVKLNPQQDAAIEREERFQAGLKELRYQVRYKIGFKKEDQLRALKILIAELEANTDQA